MKGRFWLWFSPQTRKKFQWDDIFAKSSNLFVHFCCQPYFIWRRRRNKQGEALRKPAADSTYYSTMGRWIEPWWLPKERNKKGRAISGPTFPSSLIPLIFQHFSIRLFHDFIFHLSNIPLFLTLLSFASNLYPLSLILYPWSFILCHSFPEQHHCT